MPKITALSQLDLEKSYNYADYLTWQFCEIVEVTRRNFLMLVIQIYRQKRFELTMKYQRD